jgi:hypothetical protein
VDAIPPQALFITPTPLTNVCMVCVCVCDVFWFVRVLSCVSGCYYNSYS